MSDTSRLPALRLGVAELAVSDLDRSVAFYEKLVGLRRLGETNGAVELGGEGGAPLVRLVGTPGLKPRPRNAAGLFHVAILLPTRRDLARAFARLAREGVLTGASDHLVSEAIYLDDPDGAGIEIYRDRPKADWTYAQGRLQMATERIDQMGLLSELAPGEALDAPEPAGAVVGHIHLQAADLDEAGAFWTGAVGLDLVTTYPGALFMSAGGYHHHVAANVWNSRGRPPVDDSHAGLRSFEIRVPGEADLAALGRRLGEAGVAFERAGDVLRVREPSGALAVFRTE